MTQAPGAALAQSKRLADWLAAHVPTLGDGPLRVAPLTGGTSNTILTLDRGGAQVILRCPPPNPPPGSTQPMLREARVLAALNGTAVPHPYIWALCEDTTVIGVPFYVMERVTGWAATVGFDDFSYRPPFDHGPDQYRLGAALIDGLIALAGVDYRAVGLADFGKPAGFLKRQVSRWLTQLHSYPELYPGYRVREMPGLTEVTEWLVDKCPQASNTRILHGDYGSANVLFANEPPARLVAIIDWELSTIGDPLLDLGWTLFHLRDRERPAEIPAGAHFDPRNFPTRQELAEYYAAGTGLDVANLDYYLVLAQFKLACIVEYKVAEIISGQRTLAEVGYQVDRKVLGLIAAAAQIVRRSRL